MQQQSVDTGHSDIVHDAQVDFYGKWMATCSSDRTIRIFDIKSGGRPTLQTELKGHQGPVWQLSWSHPMHDSLLASSSHDRTVRIWRNETSVSWNTIYIYEGHEASVDCVEFAPFFYGVVLACGSADGAISILKYCSGGEQGPSTTTRVSNTEINYRTSIDERSGQWVTFKIPNAHSIGVNAISWWSNHNMLSSAARFVSGGSDGLLKIWMSNRLTSDWELECVLSGAHDDWVRDVKWLPLSPNRLNQIVSVGQDKRLVVWQSANAPLPDEKMSLIKKQVISFDDVLWSVDCLPHGTVLAVTGRDNKTHILDYQNGSFVRVNEAAPLDVPPPQAREKDDDHDANRAQNFV